MLFDDRSVNTTRTSGWERYSRGLLGSLGDHVTPLGLTSPSLLSRLKADWAVLPTRSRGDAWIHFPTFPPTPLVASASVWTLHDLTWWRYPEASSRAGRHYYRHLANYAVRRSHIVTVSHQVKLELQEDFDLSDAAVTVAYQGVTALPAVEPEARDRPYLLAVGTLEPRKNLVRLIDAYERSGLATDVDLLIVGRLAWGATPREPAGLHVLSGVDDARLSALYAGAQALVAPSIYEGFGIPLIEAALAGCPVFCSDIPVFREVMSAFACYFDPYDVDAIAAALVSAMEAREPAGARTWAQRYTWPASVPTLLDLYSRLEPTAGS